MRLHISFTTLVLLLFSTSLAGQTIEAKLIAGDGAAGDRFGDSVALHGNTALIGAPSADEMGLDSGSAYVFVWDGVSWVEQAELTASDGAADDRFGLCVALHGDTALVGAYQADSPAQDSGAVYVFVRSGTTWVQQAKLIANDGAAGDLFGTSVAVDGNTALVGAQWDDDTGTNAGSAYVFVQDGLSWVQQAKLLPDDQGGVFGGEVALDADSALIAAFKDEGQRGSAYVFVRDGTSWSKEARLIPSDGVPGDRDRFGFSVSIDGDTALVGAHNDSAYGYRRGAVFVYTRMGTTWTEEAKLIASDAQNDDRFGAAVALEEDTAVVGATLDDGYAGSAYFLAHDGATWVEQAKITASDRSSGDRFGLSVALNGGIALIGASFEDENGVDSGAAYVFYPPPNAPPTADAGQDQSIHAGDEVYLNGGNSFDDNTPSSALLYSWSFSYLPAGSEAWLSGADTATPSFVADLPETYVVQLVVTDEGGLQSAPAEVVVSAENLPPTAVAGEDQLAVTGTTVYLDGRGSHDPESDPLTHAWSIAGAPPGSTAALAGADTDMPTLVPDLEGLYEILLVVSDFLGPGSPDTVAITATTAEEYAEIQTEASAEIVEELSPGEVTTKGNRQACLNFLSQAMLAIQEGDLETARHKLEQAMGRSDGCVLRGSPDGNGPGRDWITDCTAQTEVYLLLESALEALEL